MTTSVKKPSIRIIKSSERAERDAAHKKAASKKNKNAQQAAREMMSTVSDWVNDIHQRQQAETARAMRALFPETSVATK